MTHDYSQGTSGYSTTRNSDKCKNVRLRQLRSSDVIELVVFPFVASMDKVSECIMFVVSPQDWQDVGRLIEMHPQLARPCVSGWILYRRVLYMFSTMARMHRAHRASFAKLQGKEAIFLSLNGQ